MKILCLLKVELCIVSSTTAPFISIFSNTHFASLVIGRYVVTKNKKMEEFLILQFHQNHSCFFVKIS